MKENSNTMTVYNTMTRKKEKFEPIHKDKVTMYACGITAYDYCHIGHARSAVVFDLIARYLRFQGYNLTFIRNFISNYAFFAFA